MGIFNWIQWNKIITTTQNIYYLYGGIKKVNITRYCPSASEAECTSTGNLTIGIKDHTIKCIFHNAYCIKSGWLGWGNHLCIFCLNSFRPRQNGRYTADDIFKWIFLNENVWFPTKISVKFVPKDPINRILALVQIMAWRRPGDKPLSEPMMVSLLTHICVTRPK